MSTPRPKGTSLEIRKEVAKRLAPDVHRWIQGDTDIADIEADLTNILELGAMDGYELAKEIEDKGYCPDANLVEILDNARSYQYDILKKAQVARVSENNLTPIPLETKVKWLSRFPDDIGIVTNNYPDGKSSVFYESKGHVRTGVGSHGFIVPWEELTVI